MEGVRKRERRREKEKDETREKDMEGVRRRERRRERTAIGRIHELCIGPTASLSVIWTTLSHVM